MLVKSVSAVMGEGRRGAIEGRVEDRGGWNDHSDVMEMIRVWERNMGIGSDGRRVGQSGDTNYEPT